MLTQLTQGRNFDTLMLALFVKNKAFRRPVQQLCHRYDDVSFVF